MKAFLYFTLFLTLSILPKVSACSCEKSPPPAVEFQRMDAVFTGKVIAKKFDDFSSQFEFEIIKSWKGVEKQHVVIWTANSGASCGYHFKMGQSYLVYAREGKAQYFTSICTRTRHLSKAQDDISAFPNQATPAHSLATSKPSIFMFSTWALALIYMAFLTPLLLIVRNDHYTLESPFKLKKFIKTQKVTFLKRIALFTVLLYLPFACFIEEIKVFSFMFPFMPSWFLIKFSPISQTASLLIGLLAPILILLSLSFFSLKSKKRYWISCAICVVYSLSFTIWLSYLITNKR